MNVTVYMCVSLCLTINGMCSGGDLKFATFPTFVLSAELFTTLSHPPPLSPSPPSSDFESKLGWRKGNGAQHERASEDSKV